MSFPRAARSPAAFQISVMPSSMKQQADRYSTWIRTAPDGSRIAASASGSQSDVGKDSVVFIFKFDDYLNTGGQVLVLSFPFFTHCVPGRDRSVHGVRRAADSGPSDDRERHRRDGPPIAPRCTGRGRRTGRPSTRRRTGAASSSHRARRSVSPADTSTPPPRCTPAPVVAARGTRAEAAAAGRCVCRRRLAHAQPMRTPVGLRRWHRVEAVVSYVQHVQLGRQPTSEPFFSCVRR